MRTEPVWKQDEISPGNILADMIGEAPIIQEIKYDIDPRKPRFVFNPFRNRRLDPWYQGMYNLMQNYIPERMILPLTIGSRPDVDYNAMRTDSLEASERYVPPADRSAQGSEMKNFERMPVHNAISMVSEYGQQYGMPTGFCQITELDGVEDMSIALRVTRLCFPEARVRPRPMPAITIDEDLEHIEGLINRNVQDVQIVSRIFQAMNENKAWAEEHYRRIISQIDEHASNPLLGKSKADRLDVAVCSWLGVPVPKSVSKTDQGGQQKVRVEMVGQQPQDFGPQIQCATCGERSNLLPDGNPPRLCRGCRTEFAAKVEVKTERPAAAGKSKARKNTGNV